jgi:hypothetical protein
LTNQSTGAHLAAIIDRAVVTTDNTFGGPVSAGDVGGHCGGLRSALVMDKAVGTEMLKSPASAASGAVSHLDRPEVGHLDLCYERLEIPRPRGIY